jgi:hypothetical protein
MVGKAAAGMTPNRRKFTTYVKDRERMAKQALSAIQQKGPAAALEMCRVLANEIDSDLYEKKPEHFFDISWLAELQVWLERAVSVLDENLTQVGSLSGTVAALPLRQGPACGLPTPQLQRLRHC